METTVRVGIGVLLLEGEDDDLNIFLGKRKSTFGFGKYSLPGGKLEFGESFAECAAREVKEETSLDLSEDRFSFVGVTNDIIDGQHYATIYLMARLNSEECRSVKNTEPDKCEGWHAYNFFEGALPEPLWEPLVELFKSQPIALMGLGCALCL